MTAPEKSALAGFRVIELANERIAFAGKLLADMGADVILVEPPGGDPARRYPPFLDDVPGPERSLWWWHYNTSKRGVTLDLERNEDRAQFKELVTTADILLESEPRGRLAALGLDYHDLRAARPELIFVSMTPYGRGGSDAPAVDLTLLAGGGPAWSCGYDDHTLPPVRGGGGQSYHTGCHFAAMSALTALFWRLTSGEGQFIDVSMHQAQNVTTEAASYSWLVAQQTVQRQTGRHAAAVPTGETQMRCQDGRWVNTGVPPRSPADYGAILGWVRELALEADFPEAIFLEMGANLEKPLTYDRIGVDDEATAIFMAGREALALIAANVSAYDYFIGCQRRGVAVGVIYSPEEAFEDEHFKARGFQVAVEHEDLARTFRYPGAPYRLTASPWRISRRAPKLGEHNAELLRQPAKTG
ncbi:MAG TPA: CoA transferase [Caulobacteraceae bacterium]|nr:CoA transferase [Caulobacteraceae bacterium]